MSKHDKRQQQNEQYNQDYSTLTLSLIQGIMISKVIFAAIAGSVLEAARTTGGEKHHCGSDGEVVLDKVCKGAEWRLIFLSSVPFFLPRQT